MVILSLECLGDGIQAGVEQFWETMWGLGDVQGLVPVARWDMDAVYTPDILPGKMSVNVRRALMKRPSTCHLH